MRMLSKCSCWLIIEMMNSCLVIIIIIIIIIITTTIIITTIILVITCMQGIHNYVPETIHVSRVRSAEAVLYVQFVLHVIPPVKYVRTLTLALPAVCVWLCCAVLCCAVLCCAQYGRSSSFFFLQFLNFALSRFVAQVLSK